VDETSQVTQIKNVLHPSAIVLLSLLVILLIVGSAIYAFGVYLI